MKNALRPMSRADRPALLSILRATPEFKPAEVVVAIEVIDSYLEDPHQSGYYILVAEDSGAVTGYIGYGPTPLTEGTWDIYWMAVAPDRQHRGIGTALLEAAEKDIAGRAGRLVLIETSSQPSYEDTRRFHNRQGYHEIARVPDFYSPGDDRLILQKRFDETDGQE